MREHLFRKQPLSIVITTAGFNLFSPCYQMRQTCIEILENLKQDDAQFSAIFELDETDSWDDEKVWCKSNPNIDITVTKEAIADQVQMAKNNTSLEVAVKTKNLNLWCNSIDTWLTQELLMQHTQKVDLKDFAGQFVYCGVDLASVSDLTALSVMIPQDDKYYFKTFYYLPQSALIDNSNSEYYKEWKRKGYLTITQGNVTDYDYITNDLLKINKDLIISKIAYDEWNSVQWAIDATDKGLPIETYSQSIGNFNKPTKELERLIKSGKVVIDDNEITRFCFSNVVLKQDHNANVKPTKETYQNKIDGVISMIQALGIYLENTNFNNEIFAL